MISAWWLFLIIPLSVSFGFLVCGLLADKTNESSLCMDEKWNKANHGLPKKDQDYLVICNGYCGAKYATVCHFVRSGKNINEDNLRNKKNIFYSSDSEYGYYEQDNVICWMEIPHYDE